MCGAAVNQAPRHHSHQQGKLEPRSLLRTPSTPAGRPGQRDHPRFRVTPSWSVRAESRSWNQSRTSRRLHPIKGCLIVFIYIVRIPSLGPHDDSGWNCHLGALTRRFSHWAETHICHVRKRGHKDLQDGKRW